MNIQEYLNQTLNSKSNNDNIRLVNQLWKCSLNNEISVVISHLDKEIFIKESGFIKILSFQEVMDSSDDMNVDFTDIGIIPVIDTGDNDYIAYSIRENIWCKFNIADEFEYDRQKSIRDYFLT